MSETWAEYRFPQFADSLRRLTRQHQEFEDEPLHLAISYSPAARDQEDIFLLEVIGGLAEKAESERDLFETTFLSTPAFPMAPDEELHLILAGPQELEVGLREGWPSVNEIVNAVRSGDYAVLHADGTGKQLLDRLRAAATQPETIRG